MHYLPALVIYVALPHQSALLAVLVRMAFKVYLRLHNVKFSHLDGTHDV